MVTLHHVMTTDVQTVSAQASVRELAELLSANRISGCPVVEGDRVVGVVSTSDLLEFDAITPGVPVLRSEDSHSDIWAPAETWREGDESPSAFFINWWEDAGADVTVRATSSDSPEWDRLEEHTVDEIMTRAVCALSADMGLDMAARYMLRAGIHRVLVMDHERLLGIVTTTDLIKAIAQYGIAG
ncbi:MAG: CBS domain-containing protein [Gemmatimonadota bacterium]